MSIRKNTTNRYTLFRTCYVCGQTMITTADTPFMRQLRNVDGKKEKTVYFCSESCKESTYIHHFDGLSWKRRKEREARRDKSAQNKRYYENHADQERERAKQRYHSMSDEERAKLNAYRRRQRALAKKERNNEGKNEKNAG